MLDSARYHQNAAECLSAAMDAQQPDYRDLHLALARSWISFARKDEAVATLLAIWRVADSLPGMRIPGEAAHHSGMKPPTDSEMISPAVPR